MAQVHRFRDSVALFIGEGATLYLSPRDAKRLAKALNVTARDALALPFADSQCGTHHLPGIALNSPNALPPIRRKPKGVAP